MYENILVLEFDELIAHDEKTGDIAVDKGIFDDFVEGAYIQIHFVEDDIDNHVSAYEMIFEDDDDDVIFMRYLWDEFI